MSPLTKSAKKSLRQNLKRREKNLITKRKMKNLLKEVRNLISQKKFEEAKKSLPQIYKILDKAAKIRIVKRSTAARKKSRLAKVIFRSSH